MINITEVNKNFLNQRALDNVNIEIRKGEIFGIVGHSGAGKSTLLRCINGLESYDNGHIKIMDTEVKDQKGLSLRKLRKEMGMIFQNFNLLNRSNVFENIALPMKAWGCSKEHIEKRVKELLKLVGLEDKMLSMPRELSGGQKQRVAIARALSLSPKILLCDEATSALDPNTTKSILQLLNKINEELKITIVIVTHQMEVIKEICSKVAIMDTGKVVECGNVENLFLKPSVELKKLIGEDEVLPDEGVNIKIFYPKEISNKSIITSMAREFDIDFSIVWGKLEKFRGNVLGTLVINVEEKSKEKVLKYLNDNHISWEVIQHVN